MFPSLNFVFVYAAHLTHLKKIKIKTNLFKLCVVAGKAKV